MQGPRRGRQPPTPADEPPSSTSAGTLFVVATPIGNLEDVTLRALRVLRDVTAIAAEDTRRTGNLLQHYQIATPVISLHEHNEQRRIAELLPRLRQNQSIALVSDAGTPGVSDPGARLVKAARDAGLRVEPIPGPSAVTAALAASGLPADRFLFAGFPPQKSTDRKRWLSWVADHHNVAVVCFEAPHRLRRTLEELGSILVNRPIMVARELTKLHEEWVQGSALELAAKIDKARGEYVFIVAPADDQPDSEEALSDNEVSDVFGQITESGAGSRREAIRLTAQRLGLSPRSVYAALERSKQPS